MLGQNCPHCSKVPLMRQRDGGDWCVSCKRFAPSVPSQQQQQQRQQQEQQQQQQRHEEEEKEDSDSELGSDGPGPSAGGHQEGPRGPFQLSGSFSLQASDAERLAACSAALKREGAAAAAAVLQQQKKIQRQPPPPPQQQQHIDTPAPTAVPSAELMRWKDTILTSRQQPQQQQLQEDWEEGVILHQTRTVLLRKIHKYNAFLQADSASITKEHAVLAALRESLEALRLLEPFTLHDH